MVRQPRVGQSSRSASTPWVAALGTTLLMQTVVFLACQAMPVIAPLVTASASLPPESIGHLSGLTALTTMVCLACGGPVLARLGPIRTLQIGAAAATLGLMVAVATVSAGWPAALFTAALLLGLGNGPTMPAGSRILARTAPPEHRTLIFSVKQAGAPLGGALAGLVLPPIAVAAGWPAALLLTAGVTLASALVIQPQRAALDAEREPHRQIGLGALLAPANLMAPFAALRLHPLLPPLALLACSFNAVQGCLFALTVAFLVEARGLTLAQAGAAYAVMQAAGVAGRLSLGWLADRTGAPARNMLVQAFAASATTAAFALLPAGAPVVFFLLGGAAAGFTATSWGGLLLAEVARVTPPARVADATSGAVLVCFIGYSAAPIACAAAVSATGGWTVPLVVVAAQLAAAAAVLTPWMRAGWRRS